MGKDWTPFLENTDFNDQEAQRLALGIRQAKTPPEMHGGWKGNQLRSNTIIEAWVGAREVFGELWTKDILIADMDWETDEEYFASQPLLTSIKKLCFKDKESILKVSRYTRKTDSVEPKGYFKPRSNIKPKNKRGNFRKMAF